MARLLCRASSGRLPVGKLGFARDASSTLRCLHHHARSQCGTPQRTRCTAQYNSILRRIRKSCIGQSTCDAPRTPMVFQLDGKVGYHSQSIAWMLWTSKQQVWLVNRSLPLHSPHPPTLGPRPGSKGCGQWEGVGRFQGPKRRARFHSTLGAIRTEGARRLQANAGTRQDRFAMPIQASTRQLRYG
jgi:hypothetical protein